MGTRVLLLFALCLAIAADAQAGRTLIEARVALPVSGRDVGGTPLGVEAGVGLITMSGAHFGVGLDLGYQFWPASSGYQHRYDQFLRRRARVIDGSEWAFQTYQVGASARILAPQVRRATAWGQFGVGLYFLDENLARPDLNGATSWYVGKEERFEDAGGWTVTVGSDFAVGPGKALGLHMKYHHFWQLRPDDNGIPDFHGLTLGGHLAFE